MSGRRVRTIPTGVAVVPGNNHSNNSRNISPSSALSFLNVLESNIQEEYEKLDDDQGKPNHDGNGSFSVRELRVMHTGASALVDPQQTTRRAVLEAWKTHVQALREYEVFLAYVGYLENFFSQLDAVMSTSSSAAASAELSEQHATETSTTTTTTTTVTTTAAPIHIQNLLHLMTATAKNNKKDASTECRYATLLEIMLTYSPYWRLSNRIEALWKKYAKHPLPILNAMSSSSSIGGYEFRRTAYGILLSLNWVPDFSPGLYGACGMEDYTLQFDALPKPIHWVFYPLRSQPLLRNDCIHRVLQHLQIGSCNGGTSRGISHGILAISSANDATFDSSSPPCLGKTMLAASVVAHPAVTDRFQVLWLKFHHHVDDDEARRSAFGPNGMTFTTYVRYLGKLCHQLGFQAPQWSRPIEMVEEEGLRRRRHQEKMLQAKHDMTDLIEHEIRRDILLVLDNVQAQDDLSWFQFTDSQWIIVTTNSTTVPHNVLWTLRIGPWTEAEAIKLFLSEADFPHNHIMGESTEAKSIVRLCGYHLLTVRTVARLFRLKQVTAGVLCGLEETRNELECIVARLTNGRAPSPARIFSEVMDLVLSPMAVNGDGAPTVLLKYCFCSTAVVFFSPACTSSASVPLNAMYLLWAYLLLTDNEMVREVGGPLSKAQLYKQIQFISEALTQLGLIVITEQTKGKFVEIHHGLQVKFALSSTDKMDRSNMDQGDRQVRKWFHAFLAASLQEDCELQALLKHFRSKSAKYAMKEVIKLLTGAQLLSEATNLLVDDAFMQRRFDIFGLKNAVRFHLEDCVALQRNHGNAILDTGESVREKLNPVCNKLFAMLQPFLNVGDEEDRLEAAAAINMIGVAMKQYDFAGKPLACLKAALKQHPSSEEVTASLLINIAAEHLAQSEFQWSLKYLKESMNILHGSDDDGDELFPIANRMEAAALAGSGNYQKALKSLDAAIDRMNLHPHNFHRVEIGKALCQKGRLQHSMGLLDKACATFAECITMKLGINEASSDFVTAQKSLADLSIDMEREDEALEHYEKALKIAELVSDENSIIGRDIIRGSILLLRKGPDSECHQYFDLARANARDNPGDPSDCDAYSLRYIARLYMIRNEYSTALSYLMDSLQQTNEQLHSLERASCCYDLGMCYTSLGKHEEGMSCLETCFKIRISVLDESEPVIDTLNGIGNLHRSLGNLEMAMGIYQRVLDLTEQFCQNDARRLLGALRTLAELKQQSKEYSDAIELFMKCLKIQKPNEKDASVADTLLHIAELQTLQGRLDEAEESYTAALQHRQTCLGTDHPLTCDVYHGLGVLARKKGQLEQARRFLLTALNGRKMHENMELASCETLIEIGNVYRKLDENDSAIRCYEKCVEILIGMCAASADEMLGKVCLSLGHARLRVGRFEAALICYGKAYDILCQVVGNEDDATIATIRSLGIAYFVCGRNKDAAEHLLEFVLHAEEAQSNISIDYAAALTIMGDIHASNGNWEAAHAAWSSVQKILEKHLELAQQFGELSNMIMDRLASSMVAAEAEELLPEVCEARERLASLLNKERNVDFYRSLNFMDD